MRTPAGGCPYGNIEATNWCLYQEILAANFINKIYYFLDIISGITQLISVIEKSSRSFNAYFQGFETLQRGFLRLCWVLPQFQCDRCSSRGCSALAWIFLQKRPRRGLDTWAGIGGLSCKWPGHISSVLRPLLLGWSEKYGWGLSLNMVVLAIFCSRNIYFSSVSILSHLDHIRPSACSLPR